MYLMYVLYCVFCLVSPFYLFRVFCVLLYLLNLNFLENLAYLVHVLSFLYSLFSDSDSDSEAAESNGNCTQTYRRTVQMMRTRCMTCLRMFGLARAGSQARATKLHSASASATAERLHGIASSQTHVQSVCLYGYAASQGIRRDSQLHAVYQNAPCRETALSGIPTEACHILWFPSFQKPRT